MCWNYRPAQHQQVSEWVGADLSNLPLCSCVVLLS
jgi:hypothetical protein